MTFSNPESKRRYYWKNRLKNLSENGTVVKGGKGKRWLNVEGYIPDYYYRGMIKLGSSRKQWAGIVFRLPLIGLEEHLANDHLSASYEYTKFYPYLSASWRDIPDQLEGILVNSDWSPGNTHEGLKIAYELKHWNERYFSLINRRERVKGVLNV